VVVVLVAVVVKVVVVVVVVVVVSVKQTMKGEQPLKVAPFTRIIDAEQEVS